MIELVIELARVPILVRFRSPRNAALFTKYAAHGTSPEFTVEASDADLEAAREIQENANRIAPEQIYFFTSSGLELTALQTQIERELARRGVLRMHASAVAVDNEAYLFAAVSGTGKSTHASLWRRHFGDHAVMINDDKPLLRIEYDKVLCFGSPWNGKHMLGDNISAPVRGIAILERAETNSINAISFREALPQLYLQSYRPDDPAELAAVLAMLNGIGELVPMWKLRCNMDVEAAQVAYGAMRNGEIK